MSLLKASKPANAHALQVFVAVAEAGSMLGAARRLGLSQSAVSQIIRQLEDQFGVVLVNRANRPLTLSPYGLALRNRADILLEKFTNLKAQVLEAGQGIQPDLRIGLVDSFAATCGAEFIKAMLGKTTRLSVRTGLSPFHGEALMRREVDLIVSSDAMIDVDEVIRRRLFTEKYLVISPAQLRINVDSFDDIKSLARMLPIVRFNRSSQTGLQIERFLRSIGVRAPNWLEVDSADALTSIVASGVGWAITTPLCLLQAASSARHLIFHCKMALGISRSIYLIARHDEYSSLLDDAFMAAYKVVGTKFLPGIASIHSGLKQLVAFEEAD